MTEFPRSTAATVRNLVVASYGQGVTFWIYRHEGPLIDGLMLDFSGCRTMFQPYDPIYIRCTDGGAMRCIKLAEASAVLAPLL